MKDWTTEELQTMIARHPEQEIRMLAMELLALNVEFESGGTEARMANLLEMGRDLTALLHHEVLEASRGGEDFINDEEFMR